MNICDCNSLQNVYSNQSIKSMAMQIREPGLQQISCWFLSGLSEGMRFLKSSDKDTYFYILN